MSVKALRNQLLAAIAMVLVAALALGSSTFAWFAGNNIVTAETMKVQAVAEDGIEIVYADGTDYSKADASGETNAMILYPTSTQNGSTWVHANAQNAGAFTAAAGSYELLSLTKGDENKNAYGYKSETKQSDKQKYDAGGKQYYRVDRFNIRTVQGTSVDQLVQVEKIEVTSSKTTIQKIDKSLRVLVKDVTSGNFYNYNAGGGSGSRVVATDVNTNGNPSKTVTVTYESNGTASGLLTTCPAGSSSAPGTARTVEIYIYYEGEDVDHFSENIDGALAELTVTVTFKAQSGLTYTAKATPADTTEAVANGTTAINAAPVTPVTP